MRQTFFPEVTAAFKKQTGLNAFYYGNFNRGGERKDWTSYPAEARYGTTYVGLRNRLSVLSRGLCLRPVQDAHPGHARLRARLPADGGRHKARDPAAAGRQPRRQDRGHRPQQGRETELVAVRSRGQGGRRARDDPGLRREGGKRPPGPTDTPKDYTLQLVNDFEPAETVTRPYAYLVPAACREAVENLKRHGLELQELREDIELDVEVYKVDELERSPRQL